MEGHARCGRLKETSYYSTFEVLSGRLLDVGA